MSASTFDDFPFDDMPVFDEDGGTMADLPAPAPVAVLPTLDRSTLVADDARTEVANGRRFAEMWGHMVRYVPEWGQWLIWDGSRWRPDRDLRIVTLAKQTLRAMNGLAADLDGDDRKRWRTWCDQSGKAAGVRAMLDMARSEDGIVVHPEVLDQSPWLFGVINGVIDLRADAGERFRPARTTDLMTKQAAVMFDPDATCPRWERFVFEICDGDEELASFLQRSLGYSLTGLTREERLFFLWGPGRNGKSKLINAVVELLGDYAGTAPHDLLLMRAGDSHPARLADFHGKRLMVTAEAGQGRLDTDLLKMLTGGDHIKARRMRENLWEFKPTHTLWMTANNEPAITENTAAVWERMLKIPLRVVIPAAQRDTALAEKLAAEYSGILNWLIEGCLAWQDEGLGSSAAVAAETEQYRSNSDTIGAFVEEALVVISAEQGTYTREIYAAYKSWAVEQGLAHPVTARRLTQDLRGRGFTYVEKWGSRKAGAFLGLGVPAGDPF